MLRLLCLPLIGGEPPEARGEEGGRGRGETVRTGRGGGEEVG